MSTRLCFSYQMDILYSSPVSGSCYTLRVLPRSSAVQQVTTLSFHLDPGDAGGRALILLATCCCAAGTGTPCSISGSRNRAL